MGTVIQLSKRGQLSGAKFIRLVVTKKKAVGEAVP